ncbi:hypothetical protein M378DRAFT_182349 [Amanita muscaria Koide BX008]|uniref:Uncharacterized protein n=1 Tax=Amanita muscaria (strain Koide BX008) TaxID=946122 RepID=A0A0C2W1P2_AMAMK|nr:hypothetical protein M378DRAFT_182349 [Amanita muscaria Koide BX008]
MSHGPQTSTRSISWPIVVTRLSESCCGSLNDGRQSTATSSLPMHLDTRNEPRPTDIDKHLMAYCSRKAEYILLQWCGQLRTATSSVPMHLDARNKHGPQISTSVSWPSVTATSPLPMHLDTHNEPQPTEIDEHDLASSQGFLLFSPLAAGGSATMEQLEQPWSFLKHGK